MTMTTAEEVVAMTNYRRAAAAFFAASLDERPKLKRTKDEAFAKLRRIEKAKRWRGRYGY